MVKAILFDSWGTLIESGVKPSPLRQVKDILHIYTPFSDFVQRFERSFMTKKYKDLNEAFETTVKEFGIRVPPFVIEKLIGLWNKNMLFAKPYPDTEEGLAELKKKYKICLISNTDCFSLKSVVEKFRLEQYFDAVVFSYEVGMLKTDPKMYETAVEKLGVSKEDCIMVGDSLETDVEGAKNAGIKPILMDRRGMREYSKKVGSLKEIEKFV